MSLNKLSLSKSKTTTYVSKSKITAS